MKKINIGISEWIGLVGILIGFVVSLFFWWLSEKARDVNMIMRQGVSSVIQKNVLSDLSVTFKGKAVVDDLFLIDLAIWNAGKEAVRSEDILKEIGVQWEPSLNVLEAKIIESKRDVSKISIATGNLTARALRVDWKILEQGDGALIQLVCTGDTRALVSLYGTIVGQGDLSSRKSRQPDNWYAKKLESRSHALWLSGSNVIMALLLAVYCGFRLIQPTYGGRPAPFGRTTYILTFLFASGGIVSSAYNFIWSLNNFGPFGF
jgi:hypothetical protein